MKTLIVYYSFEGNCASIAEKIKAAIPGAEIAQLIPVNEEVKTSKLAKYLWGGKQVFTGKKPPLKPLSVDVNAFDYIILGTPVWAWTYAPAVASFFATTKIEGKKIALFCCHGGGKGKTLQKMKNALPGNSCLGEIDFRDPLKHTAGVDEKLKSWLGSLGF